MENAALPTTGNMVALVCAHDWSRTPLGPMEAWPTRLRILVDTLLFNPAPSALMWGLDGTLIYNAGYAAICGTRHPRMLGMPVRAAWPEAADFNGKVLAEGLAGRHQVFNKVAFMLERDGVPRESWFNLYYGPVPAATAASRACWPPCSRSRTRCWRNARAMSSSASCSRACRAFAR